MKLFMPLILLAALSLSLPGLAETAAAGSQPDLSRHPVYSKYDFGTAPEVIDFGTQPLAVPIGVIAEVMKRDRILRNSLREKGFEIRFHPFLKGSDISFFLKQGKIDAAMAGDIPTIISASSFDIVVTALVKQGFSAIVAKGPVTVAGLKGKRIGYPAVSNAHYALLAALSSADIKESDVRLSPMEISEMVDALAASRIDAFAAWEPMPSIALKRIENTAIVFKHLNPGYLYFSRPLVERHPEASSLLVASVIRALTWMKRKEEHLRMASEWTLGAKELLHGKQAGLSVEEIAVLTMQEIKGISSPTIPERELTDKGSIRKNFDFLKSRGDLAATATWEKVMRSFDRGVIADVLANPRKYRLNSFDYDTGKIDR
jgi:ABC-type nitrate/sulfonate/bicarbonate transport system substrate-binding protein